MLVESETPETKVTGALTLAALLTTVSVVITTLCNKDPWGGMSLSLETASWAAIGGLLALPLAGLRAYSWSPGAIKALPILEDVQVTQLSVRARCFYWPGINDLAFEQL